MSLLAELLAVLEEHVEFPELDLLPEVENADTDFAVEAAALSLRLHWDLGISPIDSIVRQLENHGILVAQLTSEDDGIDAFSMRIGERPLIVLVRDKADAARSNFDAAHELGHLALDHDAEPANPMREHAANTFASAFLMPAAAMLEELPDRVDMRTFMRLKRRWRVSLQALLYRARKLGKISESAYKRAMVRIAAAGWRSQEPGDLGAPERPVLIVKAVTLLEEAGALAKEDLIRFLRLSRDMFEELVPERSPRRLTVVG